MGKVFDHNDAFIWLPTTANSLGSLVKYNQIIQTFRILSATYILLGRFRWLASFLLFCVILF